MFFNLITGLILTTLLGSSFFNFLIPLNFSSDQPVAGAPQRILNNSLGIKTTAKSILIMDQNSGAILFSKNPWESLPIASLTKLMMAIVFLENNPGWDKTVTITKEDQKEGGIVYLFADEKVTVKDLFYLTLVASANEACLALVRSTGLNLKDFVFLMNQKAQEWGMKDTHFTEPTGLDSNNVSSALDITKLLSQVFSQAEITQASQTKKYEFLTQGNIRQVTAFNTNKLLVSFLNQGNYKILGAKTGYLEEAGYSLAIRIKNFQNNIIDLVILGSATENDRWQETKGLIDWVMRNYQWLEKKME